MKHFVEMKTIRDDGTEVTWREKCSDWEEARERAMLLAGTAVAEVAKELCLCDDGLKMVFANDYGGYTTIYPVSYHEAAQVREGIFTL